MSFIDTRTLPDGETIEADLCVIGSGPAGLAIANEFAGTETRVAVLESGGLEWDADTQSLAEGRVLGRPYPDLDVVRLRYFGGTSNHWGGNVAPLDPLDFSEREWIPYSGWPFGLDHLRPFYDRARQFCRLPQQAFEIAAWSDAGRKPWSFKDDLVRTRVFHTVGDNTVRFGQSYRERMAQASNINVFLFANVTEIVTDPEQRQVAELAVATLTGKRLRAKAGRYVLAAGGIENPRILLLSNRHGRDGLGNAHGLVGRFFMDHVTNPDFGSLFPSDPFIGRAMYSPREAAWGSTWSVLYLSEAMQRRERLPNIRFQHAREVNAYNEAMGAPGMQSARVVGRALASGDVASLEFNRHLANVIADIDDVAGTAYAWLRYRPNYPVRWFELVHIGEQMPNLDSRVVLTDDRDRLGQRKVALDWRLADRDSDGVHRSADLLARELGRAGLGRLAHKAPDRLFDTIDPRPHFHHMGTTRMHADPARGVVDPNCRLHGAENLYVAGSSVFPTVGNANPTLTIIALAMRLADHLKTTLRG